MTPLRQTLFQALLTELMNQPSDGWQTHKRVPNFTRQRLQVELSCCRTTPSHLWNGMDISGKLQLSQADPCEHSEDGPTSPRVGRHVQRCGDSAALSRAAGEVHPARWLRGSFSWRSGRIVHSNCMHHLCQSQVWTLLAANLKVHSLHQSTSGDSQLEQ